MAAMVELFCDSFDAGAAPHRARHRRHRGPGPRRPAAGAVPRPLRQPLLPADPHLRGDHRQAGRGHPAPRQDAGRRRGGPGPAPCRARHPRPLAARSTSWSAATATTPGPRPWPGASATASATSSASPATRCCSPGSPRLAEDAALGRVAGEARQGPPLRRVPLRRQELARRAPGDRPRRGLGPGQRQPLHRHQPQGRAALALRGASTAPAARPKT